MDKYIYAECTQDYYPEIKEVSAVSYNNAVEKVINKYSEKFDDETISSYDDWDDFRDYLNSKYYVALSDLEIYEEL